MQSHNILFILRANYWLHVDRIVDVRKRKRGVRASREKLEEAMLNAGFDTQSRLAEKIAQLEQLDKAPKDLVNKMFREKAVSTHSFARIASALGVQAHTIYLTTDDSSFQNHTLTSSSPSLTNDALQINDNKDELHKPFRWSKVMQYLIVFFAACVCAILVYFLLIESQSINQSQRSPITSALGSIRIVIQSPEYLQPFANNLNSRINQTNELSSIIPSTSQINIMTASDILQMWQSHLLLQISSIHSHANNNQHAHTPSSAKPSSHYQLLRVVAFTEDKEHLLFEDVVYSHSLQSLQNTALQLIEDNLQSLITGNVWPQRLSTSRNALLHYLEGKEKLFVGSTENEFDVAELEFDKAIQADNKFAAAYAEKCRTLVRKSYINDAPDMLEQAAENCNQAYAIDSLSWPTLSALAELYVHSGHENDASTLLQNYIGPEINESDAMTLKAFVYFVRFRNGGGQEDAFSASANAKLAIAQNPSQWRAHNTLARLNLMKGNSIAAISSFEQATQTVKNEIIMSNLGVMQLCQGELNKAKSTFDEIINEFAGNYLGYEQLGSVLIIEQDMPSALEAKLSAIERMPNINIHQVWASLAEIYEYLEQAEQAQVHYQKALVLLEQDELLNITSDSDRVHKVYYQIKLDKLLERNLKLEGTYKVLVEETAKNSKLSIMAKRHLSWLLQLSGRAKTSEQIWQTIEHTCPVYSKQARWMKPNEQLAL